ncbi:MAG: hypothetical protein ACK4UQ_08020 [Brevundimonas sp.]
MRRIARFALLLSALALASCDSGGGSGPAAPTGPAFVSTASGDLSGYYMPVDEAKVGKWSFDHVFVGQAAEFASWQAGQRDEAFAPVMLQFDDTTSPMVQTEIGEARSVTARVLPTRYSVNDAEITFEGRSPELGVVMFSGRVDQGALATARRNLGDEGTVVTGSLKVGDAPAQAVRLRWWMGD